MIRRFAAIMLLLLLATPVFAVNPDEVLSDPALEARARHLSAELRCLVCQNQSIDDSNAELAKDLRVLLRQRLQAGDTDSQVLDYVVSRYGEFVLLNPRLTARTVLLWASPAIFLAIGGAVLLLSLRRRRPAGPADSLTEAEKARIDELLNR